MALIFPISSSSSSTFISSTIAKPTLRPHLRLLTSIRAQNNSSSTEPTQSTDETSPKPTTTPLGFGSSSSSPATATTTSQKKQKGKRERASIIRRTPVETPKFDSQQQAQGGRESSEPGSNERAFLLTWLGLGSLILVEGIALAASGFLPEEWDNLFVKYLYPSFTPTVFLFIAGTVVYGVLKYLQNEKPNSSS